MAKGTMHRAGGEPSKKSYKIDPAPSTSALMTSAISSGLQGYNRAEATVNTAAVQIANFPASQTGRIASSSSGSTPADTADLSTSAVSLLQGRNDASANLGTIRVAEQMQKSLIDMLG